MLLLGEHSMQIGSTPTGRVIVDVGDDQRSLRSSSPAAKHADAVLQDLARSAKLAVLALPE